MCLRYRDNLLQQPCYQWIADSGTTRTFTDVAGQLLLAWDADERKFAMAYDRGRRLTGKLHLNPVGQSTAKLLETTVYGEGQANLTLRNLRGQVYEHRDASGRQWMADGYDFKGMPVKIYQSLLADPTLSDVDWDATVAPVLDAEVYSTEATIDALGRPIWSKDPGENETKFLYDLGGAPKSVLLKKAGGSAFESYVNDIHCAATRTAAVYIIIIASEPGQTVYLSFSNILTMNNNLHKFLSAQETDYATALEEIKNGRKRSHWMWYIFPQIAGLGFSEMSQRYALQTLAEARDYLAHPLLGKRLVDISKDLLAIDEDNPTRVMGSPDDMKLRSSMTLFALVPGADPVFEQVLQKFFDGSRDEQTVTLLKSRKRM